MNKKPYRKTLKPKMPLWRVVLASKAYAGYRSSYNIPKFPANQRPHIINALIGLLEQMYGVKWYVAEEG